ncbi:autotransporter-associated beta strand repeat-containing protein [Luteolibacter ambystomatis]|uniref:Autotransporter-associated beta strand repeat-containing protein n=1 Tax=Luteolibacter ambystomatis TaxID=2824561 RepID=A0A975J2T6_9BACT|nr:autotransporter-associated beta strand repeat-containing protein [Luteolibacter ambystomatis]QUE52979.1 autotransporter-associated beta strand repeat-containing protein [Luteolibacter ambystomatis]
MHLFRTLAGALAGLPWLVASAEPVVSVHPYDHRHVYETGATGFTWYWGHLKAASNRDEALRWLFQDLNIDYIRNGFDEAETANDNSDPLSINWSKFDFPQRDTGNDWVYNRAKSLNPRLKTLTYAHSFPNWLRKSDGSPNLSAPNFHAEYAEWLFAQLVEKKAAGVPCDVLDLTNEPDYNNIGKDNVANILKYAVPLLRAWVNDPVRNPYGVEMPKIMAPSCLSASQSKDWITDWAANNADAWNQIDIVSTHQYSSGFEPSAYSAVNDVRGGRPFFQSEMHCGHSSVLNNSSQLPEDSVEDQLEAALVLGRLFSKSVNNGVSVYDYYMGNSPQGSPTSLVYSPYNGTATRRKVYFSFKQLSSMQTRGSNVVKTQITGGVSGYDAIAYHSWGEQKTWLTVTCSQNTSQDILLEVFDQTGNRIPIQRVKTYETSASKNAELVSDEVPATAVQQYRVALPNHCVRTFEISWQRPNRLVASDDWEDPAFMAGGTGWNGGWVRSGSPLPIARSYNKNMAPRFQGNGSSEASIRRTLASPLMGSGILRFKRDVDSLEDGDSAVAEVYDGAWHTVWTATSYSNGTDAIGDADSLDQINVSLAGFGPITQIRFKLLGDGAGDYFHLDDVEIIETSKATDLIWSGDGVNNLWAADATPNWLSGTTSSPFSNGKSVLFTSAGNNAPAIALSGTLTPSSVNVDADEDYTFSGGGAIGGTCTLDKRGSGKLILTSANTFTGGTAMRQGILQIHAGGALGTGPLATSSIDPELGLPTRVVLNSGVTLPNPVIVNATNPGTGQGVLGVTSGSAIFSGAVTITSDTGNGGHIRGPGSGGLLAFTGPLTMTDAASGIVIRDGLVRLSGGGSYAVLAVGAGTTSLGANNGMATGATLRLGGSGNATFDLNGWSQTLAGLERTANIATVTNTSATLSTLTLNSGATPQTFTGAIQGNLKLAIPGGSVVLSGTNAFSGGVNLTGGSLRIDGQLSNSGVTATNASSLGGTGTISGATTMSAGTSLSIGQSVTGTLRFGSSLTLTGASFKAEINSASHSSDLVIVNGAATLASGAALSLADLAATPAVLAAGTKFAIIDYTNGSLTGTFDGLPAGGTITAGPNSFFISYADTSNGLGGTGRYVTLTAFSSTAGYAGWAAGNGITGRAFNDDADGDGLANGLEWLLGGAPLSPDSGGRITATGSAAAGLTFSFDRDAAASGQATLALEWTTDLAAGWPHSVPIGTTSATTAEGVVVTITGDTVSVRIPAVLAPGGRIFARLRAVSP